MYTPPMGYYSIKPRPPISYYVTKQTKDTQDTQHVVMLHKLHNSEASLGQAIAILIVDVFC